MSRNRPMFWIQFHVWRHKRQISDDEFQRAIRTGEVANYLVLKCNYWRLRSNNLRHLAVMGAKWHLKTGKASCYYPEAWETCLEGNSEEKKKVKNPYLFIFLHQMFMRKNALEKREKKGFKWKTHKPRFHPAVRFILVQYDLHFFRLPFVMSCELYPTAPYRCCHARLGVPTRLIQQQGPEPLRSDG